MRARRPRRSLARPAGRWCVGSSRISRRCCPPTPRPSAASCSARARRTCCPASGRLACRSSSGTAGPKRCSPWGEAFDLAVFNPSPHPRTDVVRFVPVPRSWIHFSVGTAREVAIHPWLRIGLTADGYTVGGQPARLVVDEGTDRIRLLADVPACSIEFVAADVPAFGWKRFRLTPSGLHPDQEDEGREISCEAIAVSAADDGTLAVRLGDRTYGGLAGLEDVGDRGDTYDFDPVRADEVTLADVRIWRRIDATGIGHLFVSRVLS